MLLIFLLFHKSCVYFHVLLNGLTLPFVCDSFFGVNVLMQTIFDEKTTSVVNIKVGKVIIEIIPLKVLLIYEIKYFPALFFPHNPF